VRSLACFCVLMFVQTFCIGAFPPFVPEMARRLELADWQIGTVAGMMGFARLLFALPAGLLVARHLRLTLALAPLALTAGAWSMTTARSFEALALARFIMGSAHALVMIGGLTAILRHHPARTLGAALNAIEMSAMLGILGGATLAAAVPVTMPWHRGLLLASSPQLISVAVVPFLLAWLPRGEAVPVAAPAHDRAEREPARSSAARRSTVILVLAFVAGTAVSMTWSTLEQFTVPLRATGEFGLDRPGVARLFMTLQAVDVLALVPLGLLADRVPRTRLMGLVHLVLALGVTLVAFGTLPLMRVGCVLVGLGMAGWMLPIGLLRQETPPARIAWRTALYRVAVDGGMFLGPFLSGVLGRQHLGVLPAVAAVTLTVAAVTALTRRPRAADWEVTEARPATAPARPS
jgi:MFS family permease